MVDLPDLTDARARRLLDGFRVDARKLLARFRIPPQDAEDLVQDTLVVYLLKRSDLNNPEGWLMATLKNGCLVYWRERRRRFYSAVDAAVLEALAEPTLPSQEHRVFLRDVLRRLEDLPERCRTLLKLRYQSGFKPYELADELGYSRHGIYKIIDRCVAALSRKVLVTRKGRA